MLITIKIIKKKFKNQKTKLNRQLILKKVEQLFLDMNSSNATFKFSINVSMHSTSLVSIPKIFQKKKINNEIHLKEPFKNQTKPKFGFNFSKKEFKFKCYQSNFQKKLHLTNRSNPKFNSMSISYFDFHFKLKFKRKIFLFQRKATFAIKKYYLKTKIRNPKYIFDYHSKIVKRSRDKSTRIKFKKKLSNQKKNFPMQEIYSLLGLELVLTGIFFFLNIKECYVLILLNGGKVVQDLSNVTTYLISGISSSNIKMLEAIHNNKPIIDECELFSIIEWKSAHKEIIRKQLWVDIFKPITIKDFCGNKMLIEQLHHFLYHWPKVTKNACLLSGPPGIGKTTAAMLVAKELQWKIIEMNASDTRSKNHLKNSISTLLNNHSISEYNQKKIKMNQTLIIMDECDGMTGDDRGGISELIKMIKITKIPIFCICNDRLDMKIRNLVNQCIDLKFYQPKIHQCWFRLNSICKYQGLKLDMSSLKKIFLYGGSDIRQVINNLQFWSLDSKSLNHKIKGINFISKDLSLGVWNIVSNFFKYNSTSLCNCINWYFVDQNLIPLMIEHNYLLGAQGTLEELADTVFKILIINR